MNTSCEAKNAYRLAAGETKRLIDSGEELFKYDKDGNEIAFRHDGYWIHIPESWRIQPESEPIGNWKEQIWHGDFLYEGDKMVGFRQRPVTWKPNPPKPKRKRRYKMTVSDIIATGIALVALSSVASWFCYRVAQFRKRSRQSSERKKKSTTQTNAKKVKKLKVRKKRRKK